MNMLEASDQWATRPADQRFTTLQALRDRVHGRRMLSRSTDLDLGKVHFELSPAETPAAQKLVLNSVIAPSEPNHWSFQQVAGVLKAPAGYLRTLPKPVLVDCLNAGVSKLGSEAAKFMTVSNPEGGINTLQAVTSTVYGRIWDADVVAGVSRIVDRSGGKFYNPPAYVRDDAHGIARNEDGSFKTEPSGLYASDHDVFAFMIDGGSRLEVGPRAKLNRGFFVWNSEVGARTFGLCTFLFNEVCGNHIIWGAQDVNRLIIRHTKGGPSRFDLEATPALENYVNSSAEREEAVIRKAIGYKLPLEKPAHLTRFAADTEKALVTFCKKAGVEFTRAEISGAIFSALAEEKQLVTLWDLVQGLTAYARGFDFMDARVDLETRAGKLLTAIE